MDYLKEIKREYPKIIPNNESDWEWENEAYEFLKERKTKKQKIYLKNFVYHSQNIILDLKD